MAIKRSYGDTAVETDQYADGQAIIEVSRRKSKQRVVQEQQEQDVNAWASTEACMFLDSLARSMGGIPTGGAHHQLTQQLPEACWLCCAELNVQFSRYFSSLPGSSIRTYHSFTRTDKEFFWRNFAASQDLDPQAAAAAVNGQGPAPKHMLMLGVILARAFGPYPEAGAIYYTISMPPWLFGWAHKWGYNKPEISVVQLQAYAAGSTSAQPQQPVRTIFVPKFSD